MEAPAPRSWFTFRGGLVRRALGARLGVAGLAVMVLPLLATTVLRGLDLYRGVVRAWLSALGPLSLMLVGPAILTVGWALTRARPRVGDLAVEGDALRLRHDGVSREVPLADVVDGARHADGGFTLRLRSGDALVCERAWEVGAVAHDGVPVLCDALRIGPAARAARYVTSGVATPAFRAAWSFLVMTLASLGWMNLPANRLWQAPIVVLLALSSWLLAAWSRGPEVTVGVDGMRVRGLLSDRFVAWADVDGVAVSGRHVRATLRDGATVSLGTAWGGFDGSIPRAAEDLLAHVAALRAARATGHALPETAAATARGGRSVDDWRASMRVLLEGQYRVGAVGEDDLRALLTTPAATPTERLGAAVALVSHDRARHAAGVRIAADAVADDALRGALREVAEGRDDAATLATAQRSHTG